MDRIREPRRTTMAANNGLTRRRHRTNTLRDSPEEDGAMELQEPTRLRDRGIGKKDRDRDRERERDRLGRTKRRRGDRLMHSSRDDGGDDTSDESINDDDDDDDDDDGGLGGGGGGAGGSSGGSVRMLPLNPSSMSTSSSSLNHHRKSFPPAKVFRPTPPTTWKAADEMIGVSVPRKARSASTKRSHECWASSSTITAEQNHRQASTSPVRTAAAAAGPASPSSSNASARKKIKPNGGGPKFRPPKYSSKSSSSAAQEEIEIEIAEVLYGMMRQPQGPSKQEIMGLDSRDGVNKSSSDAKSMISSPISNSQSIPPQNSSTSAAPISAAVPKRKKPRPVKPEDENPAIFGVRSSPISTTTKAESDQLSKMETCSSNSDKNNTGSAPENLANPQAVVGSSPETMKPEGNVSSESKPLAEEPEKQKNDLGLSSSKEVVVPPQSPKKESPPVQQVDDEREDVKATKANPTISETENQQEKFQIDLMAPPPQLRSSPERDVEINLAVDSQKEGKPSMKQDDKPVRLSKEEMAVEKEKMRAMGEETESHKGASVQKERGIELHLDLEKTDKGGDASGNGSTSVVNNKKQHQQPLQRQHQQQQQQTNTEKNVQSNSLPLPMSVPSWPGGLPPMGYMTPLQGVVSMDGTTVTSAAAAIPPPHLLFNQPRPKRCATHCYIARNIAYHQQIARMNPFWPAAAGSASLYGAKPGHLNIVPSTDLHANVPGRAPNSTQDKGHLAMFPGHVGKDKASQPATVDNSSRKQILLQQALPPGAAPSNILHGPAFIFPLNQQQAAAAASVRPGSVKSLPVTSNGGSSCTSNPVPLNASATGAGAAAAPTMSFSYPNMPGNETQYLAILQNNAYPFPIPAHVGSPPAYRGSHAQPFPFFNGSFYSSQMLHHSQIQPQQLPVQSQQNQQGHQNTSISSGSSSSQKHALNQQQKPNNTATGANGSGGGGSLQGFPVTKNPPSQPLQLQQQQPRQQLQNHHHASHPARQIESEVGSEDSPSTADSRIRATMNIYGQSFAMPMQAPNFALMTPASISGTGSTGGHGEKKQTQQHPGSKAGGEASQAFGNMTFASLNGTTAAPGLDLSSIAQNHSILQHHNYQIMAAAQAASAQNKKNYHVSEEGKSAGNSSNLDDDRKAMSGKIQASVGQSIAFSRTDVSDPSLASLAGNNVIDSSGRSINLGSASSRASASVMPSAINANNAANSQQQQQMQRNQQQILHLQKQNQFAAAAAASARSKTPSTSNGIVYSDNLPSTSSMATKYPNAVSAFPQSLVQSSSTVAQSAQWKNSIRPTTSQSPQSMASTPPSSVKSLPQQQARSQQPHTQISFAANPKSSTSQVQPSNSNQSPSPPVMVGSPTTSSVSKSTGSPRTTSASANNKISQTSSLSSQQAKNSSAMPARKSSPVGGRNVPSILSGPQLTPSSSTGSKSQLPQQQQKQQQQIPKQTLTPAQLFFSNPYMHSQVPQSSSSTSTTSAAASGYYLQRRGPEPMQRPGSSGNSSNGATVNSMKGSTIPAQGLVHPAQFATMPPSGNHHQFVPAGFSYVHPVPTAVQVKPSDQKQPAGE